MEKTRFFQVEYVAQMAEQGQPVANYLILTRECSKSLNKTSKNGAQNGKSAHRRAVLSRPDGGGKRAGIWSNVARRLCLRGIPASPRGEAVGVSRLMRRHLKVAVQFWQCCFLPPAHTKSLKNRRAGCTIPLLYKAAFAALLPTNFAAPYRGPAQGGKGRAAAGFCAPPRRKRRNQPWKNGPATF